MSDIERVSPAYARDNVQAGKALLVCAYEDDAKYDLMRLDGSMPLSRFKSELERISKEKEIIFY